MDDHPPEFDLSTLQALLEQLHDAGIDYQPETVERMNEIREVAWAYLRPRKLSSEQWGSVRSLLSHPKATVRVWIAAELLHIGETDVWPMLIAEAEPLPPRPHLSREDQIRDANARNFAWNILYMSKRHFAHLNLRPTYEEIEDEWIIEGKW